MLSQKILNLGEGGVKSFQSPYRDFAVFNSAYNPTQADYVEINSTPPPPSLLVLFMMSLMLGKFPLNFHFHHRILFI